MAPLLVFPGSIVRLLFLCTHTHYQGIENKFLASHVGDALLGSGRGSPAPQQALPLQLLACPSDSAGAYQWAPDTFPGSFMPTHISEITSSIISLLRPSQQLSSLGNLLCACIFGVTLVLPLTMVYTGFVPCLYHLYMEYMGSCCIQHCGSPHLLRMGRSGPLVFVLAY